jgi:hypothetical protein
MLRQLHGDQLTWPEWKREILDLCESGDAAKPRGWKTLRMQFKRGMSPWDASEKMFARRKS